MKTEKTCIGSLILMERLGLDIYSNLSHRLLASMGRLNSDDIDFEVQDCCSTVKEFIESNSTPQEPQV